MTTSAKILIVDDIAENRNLLNRLTTRLGHTPIFAQNGRAALAQISKQTPELILLDILMPEMDGYQVLEHLKSDNHLRHIPVIMVSAVDEIDSVVKCIERGADDYLVKPIRPTLLHARINSSLKKKQWRDQLQKSEEKYSNLFHHSSDGIFIHDLEGNLIDANQKALDLFGYTKPEIMLVKIPELHSPQAYKRARQVSAHLFENGVTQFEATFKKKSGEEFPAEISASVFEIAGKEVIQRIVRDITERKQAEEELHFKNTILSTQQEASIDGILVANDKGEWITFNQRFVEIWGISADVVATGSSEQALEAVKSKLIDPEQFLAGVKYLYEQRHEKSHEEIELVDGRTLERYSAPMRSKNRYYGRVWYYRDITQRKQVQEKQKKLLKELESANQELKDFAYIVSHDLKAPLRGISSLADWISTDYGDRLDRQGQELLNLLIGRAKRMDDFINGILQYSRVGRIREEKVSVNLNTLVPEVIDLIAPPKNITIEIENELPKLLCEKVHIQQIFQNLLSNAIKYMDKPKGIVKVGSTPDGNYWRFNISDNGPGIKEKYFEKIFLIFQTLAPRDESESTGVGLALAKKIIEMYGGKIWIESKSGDGSTFFFTLPRGEV